MKQLLIVLLCGYASQSFAQSRKEQIASLSYSLDSIKSVLTQERSAHLVETTRLNLLHQQTEAYSKEKSKAIEELNKQLQAKQNELEKKIAEIKSVNNALLAKQKEVEQLKIQIAPPPSEMDKPLSPPSLNTTPSDQSTLMQKLATNRALVFKSKTAKLGVVNNGKLARTETVNRSATYPFYIDIKLFSNSDGRGMTLMIEDQEYERDEDPIDYVNCHIDGNTIRGLLYDNSFMDGYNVVSVTLLTDSIIIKEYNLDISILPTVSEMNAYEKAIKDFIVNNQQGKFKLTSVETYLK